MGEAKRKIMSHKQILRAHPWCIYCGSSDELTVEHMPPVNMFLGRQRPRGLEFPSCRKCNNGTSQSDLFAAMLGRAYPKEETEGNTRDFIRDLQGIKNNFPDVLHEMEMREGLQQRHLRKIGMPPENGILRVDGPLVTKHMLTFAAKIGFALHFETFGRRVPDEGGVYPVWYSNVQGIRGDIPKPLREQMPPALSLSQGRKHVYDQFTYTGAHSVERDDAVFYVTFRASFAVSAVTTGNVDLFERLMPDAEPIIRPGDLPRVA